MVSFIANPRLFLPSTLGTLPVLVHFIQYSQLEAYWLIQWHDFKTKKPLKDWLVVTLSQRCPLLLHPFLCWAGLQSCRRGSQSGLTSGSLYTSALRLELCEWDGSLTLASALHVLWVSEMTAQFFIGINSLRAKAP